MFFQGLSRTRLFKAQLSKSWITVNFDCSLITVHAYISKRFGTPTLTLTFQKTFSTNKMNIWLIFNRGPSVIFSAIQSLLLKLF